MNATMIENKEILFRSRVNTDLINAAEIYFRVPLSNSERKTLTELSLRDKLWLIDEYSKEIEYAPADLTNIY